MADQSIYIIRIIRDRCQLNCVSLVQKRTIVVPTKRPLTKSTWVSIRFWQKKKRTKWNLQMIESPHFQCTCTWILIGSVLINLQRDDKTCSIQFYSVDSRRLFLFVSFCKTRWTGCAQNSKHFMLFYFSSY